jgi:bifunctional DNA-binding transcriptional regulator/antitoxin component of YhaV-PrlF toxin-antitoxin module
MGSTEIKSTYITPKGKITLPEEYRKRLMKNDGKIAIIPRGTHLEIMPLDELQESLGCAVASEESLKESWDSPEEDKAWKYLEEFLD